MALVRNVSKAEALAWIDAQVSAGKTVTFAPGAASGSVLLEVLQGATCEASLSSSEVRLAISYVVARGAE